MINNKLPVVLGALFVFAALLGWYLYQSNKGAAYTINRTVRYGFTLQNTTNRLIENARFQAFAPVKQTSFQLTKDIQASYPFALTTDVHGNTLLTFSIDKLPPYASKVITITAKLALSDEPVSIDPVSTERYLGNEKYIETTDPVIIDLANKLTGRGESSSTEKTFKWVSSNIKYAGYIKDDRGAAYALKNKTGDCTEYMYLYTALSRVQNIPTRGIGGYVTGEDSVLRAKDFHNWAESYIDGAWRVIDPQNKQYLSSENHYIALRIISSNNNGLLENTHRFSYVGEGLVVRMQ